MIKTITKLSLIGLIMFCVTTGFAQIPESSPYPVDFIVTDANGNESSFPYRSMDGVGFGVNLFETVGGEVDWADDDGIYDDNMDGLPDVDYTSTRACSWGTVASNVAGKIALIDRGSCFFSQKVYNVQAAGAIGAIICNDDVANPDMAIPFAGEDSSSAVVIPAIMVSVNTCLYIVNQMDASGAANAEFRVSPFNSNFGPYAYGTPIDQIRPLDKIQVSLLNIDPDNDQSDIVVNAKITDPSGSVVTLTEQVETLPSLINWVVEFDDYLPTVLGTYTIEFSNSFLPDILTNTFKITPATWHMDNGNVANYSWVAPGGQQFIDDDFIYDFGNTFLAGPNGGIAAGGSFMLENPNDLFTGDEDSDKFEIVLYDIDPYGTGNGPNGSIVDDYSAFELMTSVDYSLTGNENPYEAITVQFDNPAILEPNGQYLLMVKYNGLAALTGIPPHYVFGGTEKYPYWGTFVFTDQLHYAGWGSGAHGVIRLHTNNFNFNPTDVEEVLEPNKLNVFPSPTNDYVNLKLDLASAADEVRVGIMDMMGKVVQARILNNVQNDLTKFDVSNLSSGTYFMTVVTPEGYSTVKFIIAE